MDGEPSVGEMPSTSLSHLAMLLVVCWGLWGWRQCTLWARELVASLCLYMHCLFYSLFLIIITSFSSSHPPHCTGSYLELALWVCTQWFAVVERRLWMSVILQLKKKQTVLNWIPLDSHVVSAAKHCTIVVLTFTLHTYIHTFCASVILIYVCTLVYPLILPTSRNCCSTTVSSHSNCSHTHLCDCS